MNRRGTNRNASTTRRWVLTAGATAALTSVAGCSTALNAIGDRVLEQVNVFNQTGLEVEGTVRVITPDGDTALDEPFDLPSREAEDESNFVAYADVWTTPGEYEVRVELANLEIEGVSRVNETVSVDDVGEDMVAVAVGSGDPAEPIAVRVGESFSDFGRDG
jgi:hypothetical protein